MATMQSTEKLVNGILSTMDIEDITVDKFLGDDAIQLFCSKLKSLSYGYKKRLTLRGNNIGTTGAVALSELLRDYSSLVYLSLEWNSIGSIGCKALADNLEYNNSLTLLDLRNNSIDNDGAVALANAIKKNSTLATLDLRWNKVII